MISIPHVKEEQYTLLTEFYLDQNGLFSVDKAVIIENYFEDKIIPPTTTVKKDTTQDTKDANKDNKMETDTPVEEKKEEAKIEKVKKERRTNCIIKLVSSSYGHDTATMANFIQREANQEKDDLTLKYTKDKRNEIESFIYSTKEKLQNELLPYSDKTEAESVLKILIDSETWLYNNHDETYNKAIMEDIYFKTTVPANKIYKRRSDWDNLETALSFLKNGINNNITRYDSQFNLAKENKALLNAKELDDISKLIKTYNDIFNQNFENAKKSPKSVDCPLNSETVTKYASDLEDKVNRIFVEAEKRLKEAEKSKEDSKKKENEKAKVTDENKDKKPVDGKSETMDLD